MKYLTFTILVFLFVGCSSKGKPSTEVVQEHIYVTDDIYYIDKHRDLDNAKERLKDRGVKKPPRMPSRR